jgi:hypothetical protein
MGHKGYGRTGSGGSTSSLAARMTTTDDDDMPVSLFHVKHLFPNTEGREDITENVIRRNTPS